MMEAVPRAGSCIFLLKAVLLCWLHSIMLLEVAPCRYRLFCECRRRLCRVGQDQGDCSRVMIVAQYRDLELVSGIQRNVQREHGGTI